MTVIENINIMNFSPFRKILWPIHKHEHKKFIPLMLIFFLVSFNYNILRTVKETLVVTAPDAGADVIPFIKVWAMFPGAILMTFIFTWLSNRFSKETVFYVLVGFFLSYFLFFVIYLFPNYESLHFHDAASVMQTWLPEGCHGLISMFRHWTFTIFYVMSELWSNIVLTVLFWGFVNQVTKYDEAKRFYGLFALGANISCIFSAQIAVYLAQQPFDPSLPFGSTPWEQQLFILMGLVLGCGFLTLWLFYWTNKNVLSDPRFHCAESKQQEKAMKGKLSLSDSFKSLFKSRYLLYITIIVIAYNVAINLCEVLWKDQIKALHPDASSYNLYINQVATWIGIVSTISALFISGNAIRRFGWTFTAMITPLVILTTSILFFGLIFSQSYLDDIGLMIFGLSPLALTVMVGAIQNILSRSAKYTVYDATKELAFVPLSSVDKIKGKAAIDGVCNRLGKSGGSVIHQSLLIMFSSFAVTAPYVAGILLMIIGAWMGALEKLGKSFKEMTGETTEGISISMESKEKLAKALGISKPVESLERS